MTAVALSAGLAGGFAPERATGLARDRADADRRMGFVLALRQSGILDFRILAALERLDRARFAPPAFRALAAYGDVALPLADCQSMTRPSVVARVLQALELAPDARVLEIGAGSGYQTAALASLARAVVSVERVGQLAESARAALDDLKPDVEIIHADGARELPADGAFDAIVVNAAIALPPTDLLARLTPRGVMVAPFGDASSQRLVRIRAARNERFAMEDLGPARFAPLASGLA